MSSDTMRSTDDILADLEDLQSQRADIDARMKELRQELTSRKATEKQAMVASRMESAREKAAERILRLETSIGECWCGCGIPHAPGKRFVQGHDARFWGRVTRLQNGTASEADKQDVPTKIQAAVDGGWSKGYYGE